MAGRDYTFESVPATPGGAVPRTEGFGRGVDMVGRMDGGGSGSANELVSGGSGGQSQYTTHDYENPVLAVALQARSNYKQWMAQAGSLVADLLTCSGADRVVTCDLHESSYQGFFDIPGGFVLLVSCGWGVAILTL